MRGGRTDEIRIVALNDLGDAETNAHLTRYDTAHGRFPGEIEVDGDALVVNGDRIEVLAERDPAKLPWGALGVDVVHESTGLFTSREKAAKHLEGGAKKVIISAPGGADVDATVVYGVNHHSLKAEHHRHLQRLVHHQLPRPAGEGDPRPDRDRTRAHDDDPRLYQRPGAHRRLPLRSPPRALGHAVDDPDRHRSREGGGAGAAPN